MQLFLEFIFKDISKLTSILPFYCHPKHCRKKSSVFLIMENMDIFYLVYVYSVIPRICQNTFIFFRGEIQVPTPLEADQAKKFNHRKVGKLFTYLFFWSYPWQLFPQIFSQPSLFPDLKKEAKLSPGCPFRSSGIISPAWGIKTVPDSRCPAVQRTRQLITHCSLSQLWFTFLLLQHPSEYIDVFLPSFKRCLCLLGQVIPRLQIKMSFFQRLYSVLRTMKQFSTLVQYFYLFCVQGNFHVHTSKG